MTRRYPFAPLAAAMGVSESQAAKHLGISGSTEQQYRRDGMSLKVADRRAVQAGLHPFSVWPAMVDDALEDAERVQEEEQERKRRQQRESARRRYHEDTEVRSRKLAASADYYRTATEYRKRQIAEWQARNPRDRTAEKRAWWAANKDRINADRRKKRPEVSPPSVTVDRMQLLRQLEAEMVPAPDRHLIGLSPVRDVSRGVPRSTHALDGGSTKKDAA